MKIKRVGAYILDLIIVAFLSSLVAMIPIFNYDAKEVADKTLNYYEKYIGEDTGSADPDETALLEEYHEIAASTSPLTVITSFVTFIYFGVIAYICSGQTLGKKIMKIKVVPVSGKHLNPSLFILRSLLITSTIPNIVSTLALPLLKPTTWITFSGIIEQIQECLMLVILGFVIFREDERGLHDLICKTKVVETK